MGIVGLILGILAMVISYVGVYTVGGNADASTVKEAIDTTMPTILEAVGLVMAIVGMIVSIVGRKSLRAAGRSTGVATAGMVVGIIATVVCAIMFVSCVLCNTAIASVG